MDGILYNVDIKLQISSKIKYIIRVFNNYLRVVGEMTLNIDCSNNFFTDFPKKKNVVIIYTHFCKELKFTIIYINISCIK